MRKILKAIFVVIAIGIGVSLMIYPYIANYLFENRKDSIIESYEKEIDDGEDYSEEFEKAVKYNETLATGHVQLHDPFSEDIKGLSSKDYESVLNIDGTEVMGYINIPSIDVMLPIYHGTNSDTLEKGIGHLEGTSVPVGGTSVHTVLTGHTGLSNAKMFTDITEMEEGDIFVIGVLDRKIAYKVDQIKVVEPYEISDLGIISGKDYCTLVTCTPYGVNTHRLLVRGERTEYVEDMEDSVIEKATLKDSQWMLEYRKSLYLAIALIVVSTVLMAIIRKVRG